MGAPTMVESQQEAEQLIRAYGDLWNEQDYDRLQDVVAESFTGVFPEVEANVQGRDGLEEWMREFSSAFPDFQVDIQDLIAQDDTVVAEGIYTMTHTGEFEGIPPTERELEIPAMAKFHIEDGKVTEHREYHDRHALLEQLGVAEA